MPRPGAAQRTLTPSCHPFRFPSTIRSCSATPSRRSAWPSLLWSQLGEADAITAQRRAIYAAYRDAFAPLADKGLVEMPFDVPDVRPDGHAFCVLARRPEDRPELIDALADAGIQATFHYAPLHSSPAGRRYGRIHGSLAVTERVAATIVRLPVWPGLPDDVPARAAAAVERTALAGSPVR